MWVAINLGDQPQTLPRPDGLVTDAFADVGSPLTDPTLPVPAHGWRALRSRP
ncbi:MAG: hypothetical protein WKG07_43490 [Hymenobacter sp.]